MADFFGICGINCSQCDAYIATQNDDNQLRKKLADEASKTLGKEIKLEEINCDGCINEGRHISYCAQCQIRKCGMEKQVLNCAYCDDYACEVLTNFFDMAPQAKSNLDEIYKNLKK